MRAHIDRPGVLAALEACAELPAAADPAALRRATVQAARTLLDGDLACWYDWEPAIGRLAVTSDPDGAVTPSLVGLLAAATPSPPIARHHAGRPDGRVFAISVFLAARAMRRIASGEVFRVLSVNHEISFAVPDGDGVACIAVYRTGRDFDERERARLRVARASVATAQRVLAAQPHEPPGEDAEPPPLAPAAAVAVLTPREVELLDLLAAGLTPAQAARTVDISPRTVHKHLEHAYRKLDVTHAGAAIARMRAARGRRA